MAKIRKGNTKNIRTVFDAIPVPQESVSVIGTLRERGYMVYLMTGSMNLFARSIARKVGATGYRSNSALKFNERGELISIGYHKEQGILKACQINQQACHLAIPVTDI